MQFPKQDKEKLIFLASSSLSSLAPVFFTLSLPAKSTKNKVLTVRQSTLSPLSFCSYFSLNFFAFSILTMKTACDLEE